ncbi:MAG: hypothetical protein AAFX58_05700 [Pseudomonadota bacterium]
MADTTPQRTLLTPAQVDDLGHAILALTRELWVLTDRVQTFEAVMEKHGFSIGDEIEAYEPNEEETAERIAHSQRILRSVLGSLGVGVTPGEEMARRSLDETTE